MFSIRAQAIFFPILQLHISLCSHRTFVSNTSIIWFPWLLMFSQTLLKMVYMSLYIYVEIHWFIWYFIVWLKCTKGTSFWGIFIILLIFYFLVLVKNKRGERVWHCFVLHVNEVTPSLSSPFSWKIFFSPSALHFLCTFSELCCPPNTHHLLIVRLTCPSLCCTPVVVHSCFTWRSAGWR